MKLFQTQHVDIFKNIPTEVIQIIASYLLYAEQIQFSLVSKYLYHASIKYNARDIYQQIIDKALGGTNHTKDQLNHSLSRKTHNIQQLDRFNHIITHPHGNTTIEQAINPIDDDYENDDDDYFSFNITIESDSDMDMDMDMDSNNDDFYTPLHYYPEKILYDYDYKGTGMFIVDPNIKFQSEPTNQVYPNQVLSQWHFANDCVEDFSIILENFIHQIFKNIDCMMTESYYHCQMIVRGDEITMDDHMNMYIHVCRVYIENPFYKDKGSNDNDNEEIKGGDKKESDRYQSMNNNQTLNENNQIRNNAIELGTMIHNKINQHVDPSFIVNSSHKYFYFEFMFFQQFIQLNIDKFEIGYIPLFYDQVSCNMTFDASINVYNHHININDCTNSIYFYDIVPIIYRHYIKWIYPLLTMLLPDQQWSIDSIFK